MQVKSLVYKLQNSGKFKNIFLFKKQRESTLLLKKLMYHQFGMHIAIQNCYLRINYYWFSYIAEDPIMLKSFKITSIFFTISCVFVYVLLLFIKFSNSAFCSIGNFVWVVLNNMSIFYCHS